MKIKVVRSTKRVKTVSGKMVDDTFVVRVPATMTDGELEPIIQNLKSRLAQRQKKQALDDATLVKKAKDLNRRYFKNQLNWHSIRWVTNQAQRFGSCTPANGTIRISHRLAAMPAFVLDYVIMHELAHLLEANHGKRFWKLVERYPKTERARGYLMAVGLEELDP
ncbi:MAG: M48 family metallopeptidase [Chloroflexota bacterium]